jgi:hypothetical protein
VRRVLWGVATAALAAFLVFEAVKHGGAVAWAAVAGVLAPDLAFLAGIGAGPTPHATLAPARRAALQPHAPPGDPRVAFPVQG